jgi:hypothetical protein
LAYLGNSRRTEEQEKGGSRMLSEKPLLISEQVLLRVAGLIAVVLVIATPVVSIF